MLDARALNDQVHQLPRQYSPLNPDAWAEYEAEVAVKKRKKGRRQWKGAAEGGCPQVWKEVIHMKSHVPLLALVALPLLISPARASWYDVKNYVGTVGDAPVHVSLQTFSSIVRGEPVPLDAEGSYYYDARRIPIPLHGQRQPDGRITLCEGRPSRAKMKPVAEPGSTAARQVACPITLKIADDEAHGIWSDRKSRLPIVLHQVGSIDPTITAYPSLDGVIEIPMWHHTKKHLLLGVYQSSENCPGSMLRLRLVNIATGRTDGDIPLACEAGMIMTSIYANVSRGPTEHQVTVHFQGGKWGSEKVVDIVRREVGSR